jgi:diguanylate cyclase (GGDEF)-like protein
VSSAQGKARIALRVFIISVVYLTLWLGFDFLATAYGGESINPWYLGAALTFYLLFTFGLRYAPLVLIAPIPRYMLSHHPAHESLLYYMAFGSILVVGYALAAYVARERLKIRLPLVDIRDTARYCAVAAFAPLIIGIPVIALGVLFGGMPVSVAGTRLITFWVGDSVGLFVLVPVLAMFVTPLVAPWRVAPDAWIDEVHVSIPEAIWLYAVLVAALMLGYATVRFGITEHPLLYFTFLPLVLMALRGGLRFAIPAILFADVATTIANGLLEKIADPLEIQSFIVVSSLTALTIGALVNEYRRRDREAQFEAQRDPHTGLANRSSLEAWLSEAPTPLTVITFDVDRLKLSNDGLSYQAGDELLAAVAQRLQFLVPPFVAQVGPDQFALVFDKGEPAELARRLVALLDEPFAIDESEVFISANMGIAVAERPSELAGVLTRADVAMYRARRAERGGFTIYTAEMESSEDNVSLASGLHRAYREGEFVLYYQPLFRLEETGRTCVGVEALLRWNDPNFGMLQPAAFLDLLESMALAEKVGAWVLDEAVGQQRAWSDNGLDLSMWINLFPRQTVDPEFPSDVTKALLRHRVRPDRLVLEIVERVLSEDEREVGDAIAQLRTLGVRIAIDDFGTGHSSLARLRDLPAHILKIDGSFVHRSELDPRARGVIHAVVQIADEFHLTPLAEGIENSTQLHLVSDQGCKLAQGYFLGRPMPASQIERLFASR